MTQEIIKWDLSDFYTDITDPRIEKDIQDIEKPAELFYQNVKGKLEDPSLTPQQLLDWYKEYETISEKIFYLETYSELLYRTNNLDDDVYLIFHKETPDSFIYLKRSYGSGWSGETTLTVPTDPASCPFLPKVNDELILFWIKGYDYYYKRFIDNEWKQSWKFLTFTLGDAQECQFPYSLSSYSYLGIVTARTILTYGVWFEPWSNMDIWETWGYKWIFDHFMMFLGLAGVGICILCPVIAFDKIKHKDLEGGFLWFLGVFILGIPFIIAWLWG